VDGLPLDRAGPDECDLDGQVVERARPQPRQRGLLCAGFNLEHAHRVGLAEHVVHQRVVSRDGVQLQVDAVMSLDHLERIAQCRQHPEPEQIELGQADRRAVVLVPLQDRSPGHPSPLDRTDLDDRPIADHHPAGVDAEVARRVSQLVGELDNDRRHARGLVLGDRCGPLGDLFGPRVLLPLGVAERLGDIADGRARPVGDDVRDLRGVLAAVLGVDVLDDLLASAGLDVDVDVGRPVPLRRQEPFE
jgi:hypothetical protein